MYVCITCAPVLSQRGETDRQTRPQTQRCSGWLLGRVFSTSLGFLGVISPRLVGRWVADIKRSLVKDLNPIIAVKPEYRASVQHGATQLFQMYEADMNGHHHAVFKISKVNSKTKTEHVRQLLAQGEDGLTPREKEKKLVEKQLQSAAGIDYEDEGDGADEGKTTYEQEDRSGGAPHMQGEPDNCPYPLPSVEGNDSGKSHKTSTSNGDELEEYDEDASLGMGQEHAPADKVKVAELLSLPLPKRPDIA